MPLTILPDTHHQADDYDLNPTSLEALWRMEEAHFWHAARNRWIARALAERVPHGGRVLEVGCGAGAVSAHLHSLGYLVTGVDTAEVLVRKAHERCPSATFVAGDVARLPVGERFDAVGFFDVLEHLDDPAALVRAALRHARPGALVVVTVPALQDLYTAIDTLSGHKRRYELGELTQLLRPLGLDQIEERGIFRVTLPMLRAARRRARVDTARLSGDEKVALMTQNARVPGAPINWALRALCALERLRFDAALNRPGPTILARGVVSS